MQRYTLWVRWGLVCIEASEHAPQLLEQLPAAAEFGPINSEGLFERGVNAYRNNEVIGFKYSAQTDYCSVLSL